MYKSKTKQNQTPKPKNTHKKQKQRIILKKKYGVTINMEKIWNHNKGENMESHSLLEDFFIDISCASGHHLLWG